MKKILMMLSFLLLMSCTTNHALVEYNKARMDRNEEYLNSVEGRMEAKGEGKTRRVPLEKEAERWSKGE